MESKDKLTPSLTIEKIIFNDETEINFENDDIVLLVGANNVGKSRTLKDLKNDLVDLSKEKVLLKEVSYKTSNLFSDAIKEYFDNNVTKDNSGNYNVFVDEFHTHCIHESTLKKINDEREFYKVLFSFLSTENRLNITRPIKFYSSVDKSSFVIMKRLESDANTIETLNEVLKVGFEKGIDVYEEYLDVNLQKKYKIGDSEEINDAIKSNKRDNLNKLKNMEDLHSQGDGIRNAVAILSSLIVNDHSLFLIDEPETFLHPPQARLLGKNIVELSKNKQCFISTHNIDLIKGVLETDSSRVKIIKIDRIGNNNKFNLVDNDTISLIANDKNLKYTNILDGLFYNQLVLCEDESDCKFYSAILESLNTRTYQETLFCAVGGKHQFKKITPLLKKLNINFSIIADIDLINSRENLKQLLNSIEEDCYIQINEDHKTFLDKFEEGMNPQIKTQQVIKDEINGLFNSERYMSDSAADKIKNLLKDISSFGLLKKGGKNILPQGECVALFNDIKGFLNEHNTFILECGEIERFISDVGGHGNSWVENVFVKYEDFSMPAYDEAKSFIKSVFKI